MGRICKRKTNLCSVSSIFFILWRRSIEDWTRY